MKKFLVIFAVVALIASPAVAAEWNFYGSARMSTFSTDVEVPEGAESDQDTNWNLQGNWVGERLRRSSDSRPPVKPWLVADTTLRYTGVKNWEFAASIRNLFDEDAREYTGGSVPDDLPLPERSFYAELRYQF